MRWSTLSGRTKTLLVGVAVVVGASVVGAALTGPRDDVTPSVDRVAHRSSSARELASPRPAPTPTPTVVVTILDETSPIPFTSATQNDASLAQGQTRVVVVGAPGVLTTTYRVTVTDGVETARTQLSQSITTPPVTEVTAVGTYVAPAPVSAPPPPAAASRTVIPGGFCSPRDQGVTAAAANGRLYTCGGKGPDANGKLHWNS